MSIERRTTRLVREGAYIAEVEVTLIEEDHEWAPFIPADDMRKMDKVRLALRRGDLATAAELARVYEMKPVAAE
jgi:hypothetical protein